VGLNFHLSLFFHTDTRNGNAFWVLWDLCNALTCQLNFILKQYEVGRSNIGATILQISEVQKDRMNGWF
jgi:hypothetical protein